MFEVHYRIGEKHFVQMVEAADKAEALFRFHLKNMHLPYWIKKIVQL